MLVVGYEKFGWWGMRLLVLDNVYIGWWVNESNHEIAPAKFINSNNSSSEKRKAFINLDRR